MDFQYYNNKLAVSSTWLYNNVMSFYSYNHHVKAGNFKVLRRGGGAGNPTLIEYDSIRPDKYKYLIQDTLGMDPYEYVRRNEFMSMILPDKEAFAFFAYELKTDKNADKKLPVYVANAEVLNAVIRQYNNRRAMRRKLGGSTKDIWQTISDEVNSIDKKQYPHNLPSNKDALRKKAKQYQKHGYVVLLHGNRNNDHARKRSEKLDYLIINLYTMQNKPYAEWVHQMYETFKTGDIVVIDRLTGEIFDYTDPAYTDISAATVWNIVTSPKYEALIAKMRDGGHVYSQQHRPHHHRHKPTYSLSKLSLDDRDVMHTKLPDGTRLKAYYVYDVMSGAIIGRSYNRLKNGELFTDSIKDMFLFLKRNGIGMPLEVEVENHLVRDYENTLMTIFPFVRWTNPTNSQEKWAETGIRLKKYGPEKRNNIAVGRHYSRRSANRVTEQKIFDAENNNYKTRIASYEELVANDKAEIDQFNNELHPNQKKFPGQTRMQVFMNNINPDATPLPEHLFARYLGRTVTTSIRRNSYIKANNTKYMLSDFGIIDKLASNNKEVTGYYIPDENGNVDKVFLYQNDRYIGEAVSIATYNIARAEWTEADQENYTRQAAYLAKFDKRVKDQKEKAARVVVIPNEPEAYESEPVIVGSVETDEPQEIDITAFANQDYGKAAVNDV